MSVRRGREAEIAAQAQRLDPIARDAFLDAACGGDTAMRRAIESLLHTHATGAPDGDATARLDRETAAPAGSLDLPPGTAVERFVIEAILGRGGNGVVYRARDAATGAAVALKTVRFPKQHVVSSLRREIQTLARARHPGVVRILADGVWRGVPWYAMDLLPGEPLRHRVPRPGAIPDVGGALTAVCGLCAPLAYLHGEGIVHRDLKPDNVVLRDDDMPVLVDFGLMAAFGAATSRETLGVAGEVIGTAAYMSPEQARGELVDARADIYALGCMLYELLTGQPPFQADTALGVVTRHLAEEPRPPSHLARGIPADVDALVLRLLEKEPRRRIGYAVDLASELLRLGARTGPAAEGPAPRTYLYRPRLVGRDVIVADLLVRVRDLGNGHGGLLLVSGEGGIGKTRLAMEVGTAARSGGVEVVTGQCTSGGPPLQAFLGPLQALADRCRERGRAETDEVFGNRGPLLAAYAPVIRELPGQEAYAEPPELPPRDAVARLCAYVGETLAAAARAAPLLVVLDDLQLADSLSGSVLATLSRTDLTGTPLAILGIHRSDEPNPALGELASAPGVVTHRLLPLEDAAVAAAIGDMLAVEAPPQEIVAAIRRDAEGNPFFVGEYLRVAVAEGMLRRTPAGTWEAAGEHLREAKLPLPRTMREVVARRLDGLSDAALHVLRLAALLGRQVEETLVAAAVALPDRERNRAVTELIATHALEEPSPGLLRFTHEKLRELALEGLDGTGLRELHRASARAIDALPPAARDARLGALADHLLAANEVATSRARYLDAARLAASRYAYTEAERCYRAYLALTDAATEEAIVARNELGSRVLQHRGQMEEALREHEIALVASRALPGRERERDTLLHLGVLHQQCGRGAPAMAALEEGLRLSRATGDAAGEARAICTMATRAYQEGALAHAKQLLEEALPIARRAGDAISEGSALGQLGVVEFASGRWRESEEVLRQALAFARSSGQRAVEGKMLANLGVLMGAEGRNVEAARHYHEAIGIAREVGDVRAEAVTLGSLATTTPDLSEKLARLEESSRLSRRAGDLGFVAINLLDMGNTLADHGRPKEALAAFGQCARDAARVGNRRLESLAIAEAAGLETLLRGPSPGTEARLVAAVRTLEEAGDPHSLVKGLCVLAQVRAAAGCPDPALLARAEGLARGISEPPPPDLLARIARARESSRAS